MSTGRGYLADLPHAPDQSSWDAFPESWPAPDGPEYLGRKIEEHDTTTRGYAHSQLTEVRILRNLSLTK